MPPVADVPKEEEPRSWITAEFLKEALGGAVAIVDYDIKFAVGKGENYLSTLYRVRVEHRPLGAPDAAPTTAHLIVKGMPPGEFIQSFIEETGVFQREAKLYNETLPRFYALADGGGGEPFPRFTATALPCSRPATLVLEDLRAQGFAMADRRARLDLAHSRLVVSRLARLHALSLAYEQTHPGYLQEFTDSFYAEVNKERLEQFIPPMAKGLIDIAKEWPGFEKYTEKLERLMDPLVERTIEVCRPQEAGWNVLLHGDCWVNNFLFKYGPDGTPEDLRLVDFQLSRRGSLALDLSYFVYSSPRDEVRTEHGDELLQEYCAELRRTAAAAGFSGETPSLPQLRREMERVLFFGFVSSLTTLSVVLSDPEDTPDLSELKSEDIEKGDTNVFQKVQRSARFRDAYQQRLPYFDEKGALD